MNNCRICGQQVKEVFRVPAHRDRLLKLEVYQCASCAAHYTFPPSFNYDAPDEGVIDYYRRHRDYIVGRHARIFGFVEGLTGLGAGRFFDIGAGAGYSMQVAESRKWQGVGIEPSSLLADFARMQSGGIVLRGDLTDELLRCNQAAIQDGFDYILIDNVLEHISDPLGFLKTALPLLKDKGIMLVAIPPVDWFRVLLGKIAYIRNRCHVARWNLFYDPEQHVNYFSRKSMRILVEERLGAELLDVRFHHSSILRGELAAMLGFETGYYFIGKRT